MRARAGRLDGGNELDPGAIVRLKLEVVDRAKLDNSTAVCVVLAKDKKVLSCSKSCGHVQRADLSSASATRSTCNAGDDGTSYHLARLLLQCSPSTSLHPRYRACGFACGWTGFPSL